MRCYSSSFSQEIARGFDCWEEISLFLRDEERGKRKEKGSQGARGKWGNKLRHCECSWEYCKHPFDILFFFWTQRDSTESTCTTSALQGISFLLVCINRIENQRSNHRKSEWTICSEPFHYSNNLSEDRNVAMLISSQSDKTETDSSLSFSCCFRYNGTRTFLTAYIIQRPSLLLEVNIYYHYYPKNRSLRKLFRTKPYMSCFVAALDPTTSWSIACRVSHCSTRPFSISRSAFRLFTNNSIITASN